MKRLIAMLLALVMVLALAACAPANTNPSTPATTPSTEASTPKDDPAVKSEGVMTYAEYAAAELDSTVTVEVYVQGKQSWWTDDAGVSKATFYAQDTVGGYLLYNMACTQEQYNQIVPGTKLKVTGAKAEWSGEVEIVDATFEILEGSYIAEAVDVTALLGQDALAEKMNMLVAFKGMTVVAANEAGDAFLYKYNGSGKEGDDLYFNVSIGDATYTFCVESYLCGVDTDVYKAVQALKVGDTIDMEGFLYWYSGAQPHITSVKPAA